MFDEWRRLRGVKEVTPGNIAAFIRDIGHAGIGEVWDQVQAIARQHYMRGLADPTLTEPVAVELNRISKIQPPRWPKDHWLAFMMLPLELQRWLVENEDKRTREVRRLQNELAELKRKTNVKESTTAPAAA